MRNVYYYESTGDSNDCKLIKKRALLFSNSEWSKLNGNLTKKQKEFELLEQKRLESERTRNISKEMAKTWDNTVLNIRRRRFEARNEKARKLEEHKSKLYRQARNEEAEVRKKIAKDARERKMLEKDGLKTLTSALRFSEVLRERGEQIKFQKKLKKIEEDREREYEAKIYEDVEKFNKEVEEEKAKNIEKKRQLYETAKDEFLKAFEKKTQDTEERLRLEREDNINIVREIQIEKENARKELERKRKLVMDDVINNRKMIEEFLNQKKLEEEEEENAVKIHAAAKKKLAYIRKLKEMEMRGKMLERQEKIARFVASEAADKSEKEEALLEKAIAEKEALEEQDRKHKKEYQDKLVKELKDIRKAFLEKERQRKIKEAEELKWDLMLRLKDTEENEKFFLEKKLEADRKKKELRDMWDKQVAEKTEAMAEEQAKIVRALAVQWEKDDQEFLEYADDVLKDSKKKGRILFPINKCIEKYKKTYNLGKPQSQHKIWKSNVPIDSCSRQTQTPPKNRSQLKERKISAIFPDSTIENQDKNDKTDVGHSRKPVEPWPSQNEVCEQIGNGDNDHRN